MNISSTSTVLRTFIAVIGIPSIQIPVGFPSYEVSSSTKGSIKSMIAREALSVTESYIQVATGFPIPTLLKVPSSTGFFSDGVPPTILTTNKILRKSTTLVIQTGLGRFAPFPSTTFGASFASI